MKEIREAQEKLNVFGGFLAKLSNRTADKIRAYVEAGVLELPRGYNIEANIRLNLEIKALEAKRKAETIETEQVNESSKVVSYEDLITKKIEEQNTIKDVLAPANCSFSLKSDEETFARNNQRLEKTPNMK